MRWINLDSPGGDVVFALRTAGSRPWCGVRRVRHASSWRRRLDRTADGERCRGPLATRAAPRFRRRSWWGAAPTLAASLWKPMVETGPVSVSISVLLVPLAGIEPALLAELDFESSASTSSATGALGTSAGAGSRSGRNIAGGACRSTRADVIIGCLDRLPAAGYDAVACF